MSKYNYISPGAEELQEKLKAAFANGTECVWIVHTGVEPDKIGVEVMTPQQSREPVTDNTVLPDAGLGLGISSQQLFE
jgi:hypothetical protein